MGMVLLMDKIHANESPLEEGLLWVGSDDGLLHLTRDGGKN